MAEFVFVNYDGPKPPKVPNLRRLIRRRVMQDVAKARKQSGSYGKRNLGQYPALITHSPPHAASRLEVGFANRGQHNGQQTQRDDKLSILNLAPLTGLRLGIAALSFFINDAGHATQTLSHAVPGSQKFLSFIPQRYGHISSLSDATDCVIAKLRQMTRTDGDKTRGTYSVLHHHLKALKSIQLALNDKNEWMNSGTLCAVQLLGIFGLINETNPQLWLCHTAGASKLIQSRGPHSFQTEFDLALFTAQVGSIVTEAILENKYCFLTDQAWQGIMRSAILSDDYFANHSGLIICLWTHLAWGPNHFKAVTDLIASVDPPPQHTITTLLEQMWKHREGLISLIGLLETWLDAENIQAWRDSQVGSLEQSNQPARIHTLEIQGTLVLCLLLKARLLFALAPNRFYALEMESQKLADQAITLGRLFRDSQYEKLMGGLFISQTMWIARATLETHDMWIRDYNHLQEVNIREHGMIEKWKFHAWCRAIGRKVTL
ncbi:hypothetical protein PT974_03114 [Cladobotryum mycophilum]|uniref:Uncharacterized protein n=1 Tax=Cladobotryum mycophilum TaxID=491253 RepID=A0ABR0SSM4_9HYPO